MNLLGDHSSVIQLIIFGALAAVVLFQLYSVLGRRVGRQPEDQAAPAGPTPQPARIRPEDGGPPEIELSGLAAVRAQDGQFELHKFLAGARTAYETIVQAYAASDRATLRPLLSADMMAVFEGGIAQREAAGRTETVEFLQTPRADLDKAEVTGSEARLAVRFLAELRNRSKGPEGEAVDDRRTAELWTFQRDLKSRDPNWTLVRVDAAEA